MCPFWYIKVNNIGIYIINSNPLLFSICLSLILTLQLFQSIYIPDLVINHYSYFIIFNYPIFNFWTSIPQHQHINLWTSVELFYLISQKKFRGKHPNIICCKILFCSIKGSYLSILNFLLLITLLISVYVISQSSKV